MKLIHVMKCLAVLLTFAILVPARGGLSDDEINLLQDPGGWEYISINQPEGGIQTTHTCFDGTPHPEQCSGTLALTPGKTFVQNVQIQGSTVQRHGTYELDGNQLAFYDEFGTKDGPYTIEIQDKTKSLIMTMPQVRIELQLEKEYQSNRKKNG